ncbi:ABC-type nitrate/sulfonate/bicarbonate transport system, periplasmic component [Clostridium aceticum]|uniref:ABC-type nitrate/sulfonate/bicarbonate transport system, periplasmic component n=1 Tax=Clostridium aceticum TaxID=84022 RepID=A0A0D8IB66_9CLOT|nr:ABC transporter substrate-binding protein [Clostridium aceticum]AKL96572.1 ABC-type nitrate/sulfonate/bicarbonate transport system, periplasmic component [Clostridium aceticum]KJF27272.1 metal ABC transporter substrate-binding protein [Clostridium aceticum]
MKKTIILLALVMTVILSLTGCSENTGNSTPTDAPASTVEALQSDELDKKELETSVIRWNYGTSGNVMLAIAEKMGYLEEEGLSIEVVPATANANAMALLATGKVDIVSNAGTSNPLQQIASGVDLTVFGGHMVDGCMPVIARKGTGWNGVQDFIGKKVAINPVYFAFTGAVMDLGYEDPLSAVEWVVYTNYNDALAAVVRGEVDYALQGTGNMYAVTQMDEVEIVTYHGKVMPNYSCCRLVAQTDFIKNNPNTVKALMRALIRAQQYYEANKKEVVALHAENMGVTEEYVAAFMLNENFVINPDPLKNSVIRAWGILDKTGFLNEKAKNIDILDHINIDLYKAALDEIIEEYGSKDPEFYERLQKFYEENNL